MLIPHSDAAADESRATGVYFENLKDGGKVRSPFKVIMGVEGMTVAPAGTMDEGTGHHHLIVNRTFISPGQIIPADKEHLHFGKGETETELTLPPGQYTLTLQFADGLHRSYGEDMARTIRIEVEK
ncbi:MAG: DUF4399 domain-containing protein [Deltaproteobacteria bacterium]|nr:DUF4399 domain-containing protein [Deltaproteobacteria bacterium]